MISWPKIWNILLKELVFWFKVGVLISSVLVLLIAECILISQSQSLYLFCLSMYPDKLSTPDYWLMALYPQGLTCLLRIMWYDISLSSYRTIWQVWLKHAYKSIFQLHLSNWIHLFFMYKSVLFFWKDQLLFWVETVSNNIVLVLLVINKMF